MTSRRDTARHRGIEAVMWLAVLAVGAFILLPSLTHLAHASKEEKIALERAVNEKAAMHKSAQELEFIVNDPLTDTYLTQIHSLSEDKDD